MAFARSHTMLLRHGQLVRSVYSSTGRHPGSSVRPQSNAAGCPGTSQCTRTARTSGLILGTNTRLSCSGLNVEQSVVAPNTESLPVNVVSMLRQRGLVQDTTSADMEQATASPLKVYCGFDPTAESLHLGNLLGIIVLAWFRKCGHTPVALIGGATGRVGDPSGRSSERPVLSDAELERNVQAISGIIRDILLRSSQEGGQEVEVVNNLDWFGSMSFLAFLKDIGKHARVGTMLAKDSVRTRLESESGISFTEFAYQLLQGYDFVHLRRTQGVSAQIGGSDQWGNITAGTELVRKILGSQEEGGPAVYGLTFPLLVDSEGRKFGKSTGGAIWLSSAMLSPYKFYQYLFNTADADVVKFLKMLTFIPLEDIGTVEASMSDPTYVPNTAQKRLAEEVTRFVHGEEGLEQALRTTQALRPGSASMLDAATLESIAEGAPTATVDLELVARKPLVDAVATVKLLASKGEARRLIKGGGLYLNNQKVSDANYVLQDADLIDGRLMLLAAGKKNKMLVTCVKSS